MNNIADVSFTLLENSAYTLTITDGIGREVSTQMGTGRVGNNIISITVENQFAGTYYIYLTSSNGIAQVSQFVKVEDDGK
ncbi:MAG: T9SS type A sorting domain-containing protein [Bacteroidota bacterium]|nr:T9SS type A sorting domain-containing protein [Bacteroidota bacterium]